MAMTVAKLKKILEGVDDNCIIVLSRDPEGNRFSNLYEVQSGMRFDGEKPKYEELTDELRARWFEEEDICENGTPCVVLWPAN